MEQPVVIRVYWGPKARRAHYLRQPSVMNFTVCGAYSGSDRWHGDESDEERARAASLPLCEECGDWLASK